MNNIVPIFIGEHAIGEESVNAIDARELHEWLESDRQFADWIKSRIEKYDFKEGEDWVFASQIYEANGSGGHNRQDYVISLDMAKELAMVERNEKGRQARRYFIECEKIARGAKPVTLGQLNAAIEIADKLVAMSVELRDAVTPRRRELHAIMQQNAHHNRSVMAGKLSLSELIFSEDDGP